MFRAPPDSTPVVTETERRLQELGLIGPPYAGEQPGFLVGEHFLRLVTFMGCSPYLQLEPPVDGSDRFCHIRLLGPYPYPRLLRGSNTRPPRCPGCRKRIEGWQEKVTLLEANAGGSTIECPHCSRHSTPLELEWQRNAGVSRFFIQITEVFPGEAVPVPALLEQLKGDGGEWDYFYLTD
jgi:DNA-directed RNA polymerase subunit RPC12/RpoP